MENTKKFKKKSVSLAIKSILAILLTLVGLAAVIASRFLSTLIPSLTSDQLAQYGKICLIGGGVAFLLGVIFIIACILGYQRLYRMPQLEQKEFGIFPEPTIVKQPEPAQQLLGHSVEIKDCIISNPENIQYVPSVETFQFVNMGRKQSVEDKFAEIAKMDKAQFVVYIARLFSNKGYQVKLTPVMDNYDVDLLVEKAGIILAVNCILTNRVLSQDDLKPVLEGKSKYTAHGCLALTNMFFDQFALDFAKENRMSLVDKNVLVQDFMS